MNLKKLLAPLAFIMCLMVLSSCLMTTSTVGATSTSEDIHVYKNSNATQMNWNTCIEGATAGAVVGGIMGSIFPGVGTIVGAVCGAIFGFVYAGVMQLLGSFNPSNTQAEQIAQANNIANTANGNILTSHAGFNASFEIYSKEGYTWEENQAAIAAYNLYEYQKEHKLPYVYNNTWIMQNSPMMNNSLAIQYEASSLYCSALSGLVNVPQGFQNDYQGMYLNYLYGYPNNGQTVYGGYNSYECQEFGYYLWGSEGGWPLSGNNAIYLNAQENLKILCLRSMSNAVITLQNDNGDIYNIYLNTTQGQIYQLNLANIGAPSGGYTWTNSGDNNDLFFAIFGLGVKEFSSNANILPGEINYHMSGNTAIFDGGEAYNIPTVAGAGVIQYVIVPDNSYNPWTTYQLGGLSTSAFNSQLLGTNSIVVVTITNYQATIYTGHIWMDLANMSIAMSQHYANINSVGMLDYNAEVQTGGGNVPLPSPVPTLPDWESIKGMSEAQLYELYMMYLQSLYTQWNGTTPENFNASWASLNIVVRGAIYDSNGNMIANNTTLFSPFITSKEYDLKIGNNIMNESGNIFIWGHASTVYDYGNKSKCYDTSQQYLSFASGWNLDINQILINNVSVSHYLMTIDSLKFYIAPAIVYPTGTSGNNGTINESMLVIGIILLLVGIVGRGAMKNSGFVGIFTILIIVACIMIAYGGYELAMTYINSHGSWLTKLLGG